jgi:uncharacterized protein
LSALFRRIGQSDNRVPLRESSSGLRPDRRRRLLTPATPVSPDRAVCSAPHPELRRRYGPLPEHSLARQIIFPKLHRHHRAFIALSPFAVIASADRDGAPDVSPRGDLPGFAAVLDDRTIVLPDRPGNKKLVTLTNVLENSAVSLIFFVPGQTDSLRVNGRAQITTDPTLLRPLAA